jgi:hypothetical protein
MAACSRCRAGWRWEKGVTSNRRAQLMSVGVLLVACLLLLQPPAIGADRIIVRYEPGQRKQVGGRAAS